MTKFIERFEINIGQPAIGGLPYSTPMISFIFNDRYIILPLEDLKNWINDIWESKGSRSEKAYSAKKNIDQIFAELFYPYMIFPEKLK